MNRPIGFNSFTTMFLAFADSPAERAQKAG